MSTLLVAAQVFIAAIAIESLHAVCVKACQDHRTLLASTTAAMVGGLIMVNVGSYVKYGLWIVGVHMLGVALGCALGLGFYAKKLVKERRDEQS